MKSFVRKWLRKNKIIFVLFCLIGTIQQCYGFQAPTLIPMYDPHQYEENIKYVYQHVLKTVLVQKRIEKASEYFLGTRYLNGALGEGSDGIFDKSPLFRTDAFDCMTYVSTILALAYSQNFPEFLNTLKKIQYRNAHVSFFTRHHFTEVDWNVDNEKQGFLVDITKQVSNEYHLAKALIDKPRWFEHQSIASVKCFTYPSSQAATYLVLQLHDHAIKERVVLACTSYIPLTELIKNEGESLLVNDKILERIPSGSVIEIVDKTRDFKEKIGTDLNIAHMGFVIRTSHGILFRHASKVYQQVIDIPLSQYLKRCYELSSCPEKVGIHIEGVK